MLISFLRHYNEQTLNVTHDIFKSKATQWEIKLLLTTCDKLVTYCLQIADSFNTLLSVITECHEGTVTSVVVL